MTSSLNIVILSSCENRFPTIPIFVTLGHVSLFRIIVLTFDPETASKLLCSKSVLVLLIRRSGLLSLPELYSECYLERPRKGVRRLFNLKRS